MADMKQVTVRNPLKVYCQFCKIDFKELPKLYCPNCIERARKETASEILKAIESELRQYAKDHKEHLNCDQEDEYRNACWHKILKGHMNIMMETLKRKFL